MTTDDADGLDRVRARVAAATREVNQIQSIADTKIVEIRTLADEAIAKATQLADLMQQLSHLLERDGGDHES